MVEEETDFGHLDLAQTNFGRFRLNTKWGPEGWTRVHLGGVLNQLLNRNCDGRDRLRPIPTWPIHGSGVRVPWWGPKGGGGPKFRAFFHSPAPSYALFVSLWVSARGILVVFSKAGTIKRARLEFSGCRVKLRRPRSRQGFFTTAREPKSAHLKGPGLRKHHQNSTRRQPEREKKNEMGEGEGKIERDFGRSGGGRSGAGWSRAG